MYLAKVIVFCFAVLITQCKSDCTVPMENFKKILVLDKNNNIQYSTDLAANIVTKDKEFITLACPGSTIKGSKLETQKFTCANTNYNPSITGVTCDDSFTSIEFYKGVCNKNNNLLQIGFQYKNKNFIPQIDLCWNNDEKRVLWTKAVMNKEIKDHVPPKPKISEWQTGKYFDQDLADLYERSVQDKILNEIYNNNIIPELTNPTKQYLNEGHLAADGDFVYDAQKEATYRYINAAPQWYRFNGAQWAQIEEKIRYFASKKRADFDVYTGTNGILQLNNKNYILYKGEKKIAVPKYFWKVVVKGNLGVAIIGSNDITQKKCNPNPICPDILQQITWLKFASATDPKRGCVIACEVSKFMTIKSFKDELPDLSKVTGLLKDLPDPPKP